MTILAIILCVLLAVSIAINVYLYTLLKKAQKVVSTSNEEEQEEEISLDNLFNMPAEEPSDLEPENEEEQEEIVPEDELEDPTEVNNEEEIEVEESRPSGEQLTEYMDYLNIVQLKDYKVFKVNEKYIGASNPNAVEIVPAFLYTVFKSDGMILLMYESTMIGRNTIMFTVEEDKYEKAYRAIIRYFSSNRVNKRARLSSYMQYLKRSGVLKKATRVHNGIDSWKRDLHNSPVQMVRDLISK